MVFKAKSAHGDNHLSESFLRGIKRHGFQSLIRKVVDEASHCTFVVIPTRGAFDQLAKRLVWDELHNLTEFFAFRIKRIHRDYDSTKSLRRCTDGHVLQSFIRKIIDKAHQCLLARTSGRHAGNYLSESLIRDHVHNCIEFHALGIAFVHYRHCYPQGLGRDILYH